MLAAPALGIQAPPATALREETFTMPAAGEAVGSVAAACRDCDWGVKGREAAVLVLTVDGRYSQHLILTRGATAAVYDVMLGTLAAGPHRLRITRDPVRSAPAAGAVTVGGVTVRTVAAGSVEHAWLARAPIIYARPGTVEKFSDLPLMMWAERTANVDGPGYDYSVIFTHEDGGTPTDRLMATWGRTTDIELLYSADLAVAPSAGGGTYQGKDHEILPFRGRLAGTHPLLWVSTINNMVSDHGTETVRFAPAPRLLPLIDVSREAVMDAQPWTYAVMAAELAREGRIREDAEPGSAQVPDPRRFAYLEGCADVKDAVFAFDVGLMSAAGGMAWHPTDRGDPRFRLARTGCFRAALPLPRGTAPSQIRGVRLRAYTRPPRQGETALPSGAGSVVLRRINTVFMMDDHYVPGPPALTWSGRVEAVGNGAAATVPAGELRIRQELNRPGNVVPPAPPGLH